MAEVTRATQAGLSVVGYGDPAFRVTQAGVVVIGSALAMAPVRATQAGLVVVAIPPNPHQPTVTVTPLPASFKIVTSVFTPSLTVPGDVHDATTYEIAAAADPSFSSPLFTFDRERPSAELTSILADGLGGSVTYWVRARHEGSLGGLSIWSTPVSATTLDATNLPDTPTVTVTDQGLDFVDAVTSAFSHPDGITTPAAFDPANPLHYLAAVGWQIRETVSGTVVFDGGMPPFSSPPSLHQESLTPDLAYQIRAYHFDGYNAVRSLWSAWVDFSTDAVPLIRPDAPALTVPSCDGTEVVNVTAAPFSHPDPLATHAATRWRLYLENGSPFSVTTSKPAELTAFQWPRTPSSDWIFDAAYQDDSGRWGAFGTPDNCTVLEKPMAPELQHSGSTRICGDTLIVWDMPQVSETSWRFQGQLSADNGATWTTLFSSQTAETFTFIIAGRPDGVYIFRVRAFHFGFAAYGDWSYLILRVDRTCSKTTVYDLSTVTDIATQFPEWEMLWETDGVTWTPIDNEGNPGGGFGILGACKVQTMQSPVLAFKELGQPTLFDAEVEFCIWSNEDEVYWARFTHAWLLNGGMAHAVTGQLGWAPDERGQGILDGVGTGIEPWGFPHYGGICYAEDLLPDECFNVCAFAGGCWCKWSVPATAELNYWYSSQLREYAVSSGAGWVVETDMLWGSPYNWLGSSLPWEGSRERGLKVSTRHPGGGPGGCSWRHVKYILRQRVERTVTGGIRSLTKVFGPGLDPSGGWTYERVYSYEHAQLVGCGYIGLATSQFRQGYNLDHGVIFTSFAITPLEYDDCLPPPEFEEEEETPSPISPIYAPCPPDAETADKTLFLGGTASPGALFRFGGYEVSAPQQIVARIRPNSVAPEGYGGECLFKSIFVVVEHISDITIRIVPILNGEWLDQYAQEETFIGPGDRAAIKRYEMPLYRAFEDLEVEGGDDPEDRFKYGLRGTYFTFDMTITDICGIGLQLPGVWLEYEALRESQGTRVIYTEDLVRLPLFVPAGQTFMGTKGANRVLKAASGVTDDGFQVEARLVSNPVAPAGEAGECHFKRVTVVVTRWNANDMDLKLTPYLDGYPAPPITVHYKATTAPVTEPVEIDLTQYYRRLGADATERFRYGLRGAWFHAKVETGSGLQEWLTLEGFDLDYDVVRESLQTDVR